MVTSRVSNSAVFERDVPLFVESDTGRLGKYPAHPLTRWGLRLMIAASYAAIAIWFDISSGHDWSGTANAALAERVGDLSLTSSGVDVITQLYPPITSIAAIVIPGGALGLAVVGAVVAGIGLQLIIQSMKRKGFHPGVRAVFALTLATTPLFTYIVTTNLETVVGLMFFGLGMIDLVRFVTYANTQAGFRAGILFACSAFSDSTGVFSALVAALAGTVIIQSRGGARLANAVVVAFPTIALFASLALLGVAFGAGPLAVVGGDVSWQPERAQEFAASLATPLGWLYLAPMVVMVITSFALRYPGTALIAILLTATTVFAYIVALTPPGTAGTTYTLMLLLAIAIVPTATTVTHAVLTVSTSVLLLVIGWLTAFEWPVMAQWMQILATGPGS